MSTPLKLSEEFLSQYKGKQPKWGFDGLGYIVYLRTYARVKEDGTLEDWWETVRRFTEGNFRIEADRLEELGKLTDERRALLMEEMERFYHLAFNLVILPPGRGIWMSGTNYAEKVGDAENNCWFVTMKPQPYGDSKIGPKDSTPLPSFPAVFTFDQAMKGGGVGVNIQHKYVRQMPEVKNKLSLQFHCSRTHRDFSSELSPLGVKHKNASSLRSSYLVEDSREGWAEALRVVIDSHFFNGTEELILDVSNVRPKGEPIRGFGGTASGPAPLVTMLKQVNDILNSRKGEKLSPTEWGDIIQLIGTCVVAGNVRRTAIILIGDKDDQEFIESKNYELKKNQTASQWRWASNNSTAISPDTCYDTLYNMAVNIYHNGEPGAVNIALSRNHGRIIDGFRKNIDGDVEGFNPCGEITLPNGSPCNLFEINLPRIHELIERGIEKDSLYEEAAYLSARYAYRVTFRPYEWQVTRDVVYRHRRIGVGITGITDWALLAFGEKAVTGFDEKGDPIYNEDVCAALNDLYRRVKESNIAQAKDLEANPSIKLTTVKPSGTVSILMGVSPGQHYHWAPYMIRRVRMAAEAPLVPILRECGYSVEEAIQGFDEEGNPVYDKNTVVIEFPVKAPTADSRHFQSAGEVPLQEQAALQSLLQTYWSDNAVSATLTFKKAQPKPVYFEDGEMYKDRFGNPQLQIDKRDEERIIREIADVLYQYKSTLKSTSLLPHATSTYPQMPYEEITEAEYEDRMKQIVSKPWEIAGSLVVADGKPGDEDIVGECIGGHCPIK